MGSKGVLTYPRKWYRMTIVTRTSTTTTKAAIVFLLYILWRFKDVLDFFVMIVKNKIRIILLENMEKRMPQHMHREG